MRRVIDRLLVIQPRFFSDIQGVSSNQPINFGSAVFTMGILPCWLWHIAWSTLNNNVEEFYIMTDFSGLGLAQPLLRAVEAEGYTTPTPIQARAIPLMLEGRDIMGIAQTGTGKTAAFTLPMLHNLDATKTGRMPKRSVRSLIIAPTRELALQIFTNVKTYNRHLNLRTAVVYGGVSIRGQISALASGVDVLVATPGRLLDLMRQGYVALDRVEVFVLDEADRMLDMGFAPDVKAIGAALPRQHQTAMFSATMAKNVRGLAEKLLENPFKIEVAPVATTADKVEQQILFVRKDNKRALLGELLSNEDVKRVLIFTRSKHGADKVARNLEKDGVKSGVIHGNKSQGQRERAIKEFSSGRVRALVATDVASRGLDVDGVTHVINFDLPNEPDSYVHRIGRTGRAGATGIAISFCDIEEKAYLLDIEKTIRQSIPVIEDHPFHAPEVANDPGLVRKPNGGGGRKAPFGRKGGNSPKRKPQKQWKPNAGRKAA